MPLYEYRCDKCGKKQDAARKIADRHAGPDCHGRMNLLISAVRGRVTPWNFTPHYDVGLGKFIASERDRRYEMDRLGVIDARDYYESTDCPELPPPPEVEPTRVPGQLYEALERERPELLANVALDRDLDV